MKFKGNNLNYCPFCAGRLEHIGILMGGRSLQDDLRKGWKLIMFRKACKDGGEDGEEKKCKVYCDICCSDCEYFERCEFTLLKEDNRKADKRGGVRFGVDGSEDGS
ncbi:MAG: hypothetical protein ACTSPB_03515 [Candidatus Thorarchaeota archaeon]